MQMGDPWGMNRKAPSSSSSGVQEEINSMFNHDPIEKVPPYTPPDHMSSGNAVPKWSERGKVAQGLDALSKPKARIVYPSKSARRLPRL